MSTALEPNSNVSILFSSESVWGHTLAFFCKSVYGLQRSVYCRLRAQKHQTDIQELVATKADCCVASCALCLGWKSCIWTHHKDCRRWSPVRGEIPLMPPGSGYLYSLFTNIALLNENVSDWKIAIGTEWWRLIKGETALNGWNHRRCSDRLKGFSLFVFLFLFSPADSLSWTANQWFLSLTRSTANSSHSVSWKASEKLWPVPVVQDTPQQLGPQALVDSPDIGGMVY